MRLNFTDHYMNDYITEFKKDLNKIINDLIEKNIVNDFNFNKLSIDYSSKSKQGDISTNLFLILLKQNLKKNYDLKDHIFKFLSSLHYIEKIDIVNYSEQSEILISRALSPAKPLDLYIDDDRKYCIAIFDDDDLELAIGRGGVNVNLASTVTEFRIDAFGKSAPYKDLLSSWRDPSKSESRIVNLTLTPS